VLKWLVAKGCLGSIKADYNFAVKHRRHEIFKWLVEQKFRWDEGLPVGAASIGNLEVLKWLREEECSWNDEQVIFAALRNREFEMLKWLLQTGCHWLGLTQCS